MAAEPTATCQYRSLRPLERDVCRLLVEHERTGRTDLRRLLSHERVETVDDSDLGRALRRLEAAGYVDSRADGHGIEAAYILTSEARRELQRRWCWEARQIRGGARDDV